MEKHSQTRRTFLATLAVLFTSGSLLIRYLTPRVPRERQALVEIDSREIPVNGALVFSNERLAVMRNGNGYCAISLVCTHLGCTVTVMENGLACPCHGSRFDRFGAVITGPAARPLEKLELIELNGVLKVYSV